MSVVKDAVYGPIPSWRFGRSLGIDPTLPPKKCTLSCIYCQVGETKHYLDYSQPYPENLDLLQPDQLRASLKDFIKDLDIPKIDIVIFSGSGEPTLNKDLAEMVDIVRDIIPDKPVGILSNGTLIDYDAVKNALYKLDMVTVKLDAADQETYQKINHPSTYTPSIENLIISYKNFKKNFHGFFGLEIMALEYKGINNIEGKNSDRLINAIIEISPDVVQLEVPYRPTNKNKVLIPENRLIREFASKLKETLGIDRVWVYGERDAMKKTDKWKFCNFENRIVSILNHRPCSLNDLSLVFGINKERIKQELRSLIDSGKINTRYHQDKLYYISKSEDDN